MQKQRLVRGIAILALGLVLVWGIQATIAAPDGDGGSTVEQANHHKPDHDGGPDSGGGQADPGPPENPGNGNGNADPGPPENPGNGNGNADPGPPENPGNGNAAPPAQGEGEGEDEDQQAQGPSDKVLVCHVTSSEDNPTELIEVSENAVAAHEAHGDVVGDDAAEACEEGAPPVGTPDEEPPDGSPIASPVGHKVLVCHATSAEDNPFVLIEIDEHAMPAHEAHGDIVDVESEEDCPAGTPTASPVADEAEED